MSALRQAAERVDALARRVDHADGTLDTAGFAEDMDAYTAANAEFEQLLAAECGLPFERVRELVA